MNAPHTQIRHLISYLLESPNSAVKGECKITKIIGELRLDSRVVAETSGEITQMFPDVKHKLPAASTSKQLIDWPNYFLMQKENT